MTTKIYKGRSTNSGDVLYTFDGKYIYKGRSSSSGDIINTFDGKYLYKGRSSISGDVVNTFDEKQILKGRSTSSGDVIYTFDGKYLYKGRSTISGDIIVTFDGKYIYKGRSTSSGDILFTIEGTALPCIFPIILNNSIKTSNNSASSKKLNNVKGDHNDVGKFLRETKPSSFRLSNLLLWIFFFPIKLAWWVIKGVLIDTWRDNDKAKWH